MSPRPINPNDDEPVDAHLRAALRHAPDAQALPPAAVSAAILSQARAAAQPATAARTSPSVFAWLRQAWLALSQPALSAGLASVMLAGVVGLMWWDRVPEEVTAPPEISRETSAPPPVPDEVKSLAKPPPSNALQKPVRPEPVEGPQPSNQGLRPEPSVLSSSKGQSERSGGVQAAPKPVAAPTTAPNPPTSGVAQQRRGLADDALTAKEAPADKNLARAANPPPAAPIAVAEATHPAPRAEAPPALAKALPPQPAPAPAAAPQASSQEPETSRSTTTAMGSALRATPSAPLIRLSQALNLEPQRWRWQKNEAAFDAVTAQSQRWLDELDASTAGRWTPQMPARLGSAAPKGTTLRWAREGQTVHTLVLRPDGVIWQAQSPTDLAWFAPLDAAILQRLIDSLP